MAEVTVTLNGRSYDIACDNGQEGRVVDLAAYVDQKLQQISRSGAAYNDAHLMVLTAIVLADELLEAREGAPARPVKAASAAPEKSDKDETILLRALENLTQRIDGIATRVQTL